VAVCSNSLGWILHILGYGVSAYAQFLRDLPLGKPAAMKKLYVQNGILFFICSTPLPPGKKYSIHINTSAVGKEGASFDECPLLSAGWLSFHDH